MDTYFRHTGDVSVNKKNNSTMPPNDKKHFPTKYKYLFRKAQTVKFWKEGPGTRIGAH